MSGVCLGHLQHPLVLPEVYKAERTVPPPYCHQVWLVRVPVQALHGDVIASPGGDWEGEGEGEG